MNMLVFLNKKVDVVGKWILLDGENGLIKPLKSRLVLVEDVVASIKRMRKVAAMYSEAADELTEFFDALVKDTYEKEFEAELAGRTVDNTSRL